MIRTEYIDVDFNLKLKKDLQEDEVICPHCGGTGLQVDDNPFGLKEENSKIHFPHKQQTIVNCRYCYNGVQKKCLHCGEILNRQKYQCDCEKSEQERSNKQYEKDLETWNKAKKIFLKQALEDYRMIYIEDYDIYISTDELEDWLTDRINTDKLWIYGTYSLDLSIDASNILEDACSDLHEDARDNISVQNEEELQELLDHWCNNNKQGTTTYYPNYEVGVKL